MEQSLATKLVRAARAAGYRELIKLRSIVLTVCPKCGKKRVIRFRKVASGQSQDMVDRCWGCDYKAWVGVYIDTRPEGSKAVTINSVKVGASLEETIDMICPCGCGHPRPSKKHKYAHGKVCAARLKAKHSKKAHAVTNPDGSGSLKGNLVGMGM